MATRKVIVVDGANVAYVERSHDGKPKVSNLTAVYHALEREGFDPIVIVDASLRYDVDDPDQLEALIDGQRVRQAPSGTDADYFVLEFAGDHDAFVVTNDNYEAYRDRYPWIEDRRVPVMIVQGEVELYAPKLHAVQD